MRTVGGMVGSANPGFALQFWPAGTVRAHVVYLPPFAEEMNRCRSLVAEQARWFAGEGLSCSLLDFYGTGESRGDLTTASLPIWRQNIDDLIDQLQQHLRRPIYLWGCRLGCLLALDYLSRKPQVSPRLLLWQPLVSGSAFVTQMLRQRTAAMLQQGEPQETTTALKSRLAAGESLEVAGYNLGGELLNAIDNLELESIINNGMSVADLDVIWLEHAADPSVAPGAKSRRAVGQLQSAGARVTLSTFAGDPLWQLHKRGACPELLAKTREHGL